MTNHKEKSQPQLKTCHDQTDTFIYQKELEEGSANDELPPVSENRNLMKHILFHGSLGFCPIHVSR